MPHARTFSVSSSPSCFRRSFTCSAIAGEAVSPGDWMPATWMKPGAVADGAIRKSSPGSTGRRPAKLVMMSRRAMDGTMRPASSRMRSRFSGVVATSSLSSTSSAVGPIIVVPSTVGMTSTPFDERAGTGNTTCVGQPAAPRSRMYSSPLRAVRRNSPAPHARETSSARRPAAFTTHRASRASPAREVSTQWSPRRSPRATSQLVRRSTPLAAAHSTRAKT